MKRLMFLSIILLGLMLLNSCKGDSNPVTPTPRLLDISEYSVSIDESYYKQWSDSSYEKYDGYFIAYDVKYHCIKYSSGKEAYYSDKGYAGFLGPNNTKIMFNKVIPWMPVVVEFGKTYSYSTTFTYSGFYAELAYEYTLEDTTGMIFPKARFNNCAKFTEKITLKSGSESQNNTTTVYLAKSLSTVAVLYTSGQIIYLNKAVLGGNKYPVGKLLSFGKSAEHNNVMDYIPKYILGK